MLFNKRWFLSAILISLFAAGLLLGASPSSHALGFIDFDIGDGGTLSFNGSVFQGAGIPVIAIEGIGTPANSGVNFSFDAGTHLDFSATNHLSGWDFGPGGAITISDGVVLLTGTIQSLSVTATTTGFKVIAGGFLDRKDPTLAAFYGWGGITDWAGSLNLSFQTDVGVGGTFGTNEALVGTGDVLNSPVPEPATLLLLGCGLIGLAGYGKKRLLKK